MLKWQLMVWFETSFVLSIGPHDFPNQIFGWSCVFVRQPMLIIGEHSGGGGCSCLGTPVHHFIIIPAPPETIQACWRSRPGSWQKPTKLVNITQNTELSCYQTTSVCQLKCSIAVGTGRDHTAKSYSLPMTSCQTIWMLWSKTVPLNASNSYHWDKPSPQLIVKAMICHVL